MARAILIGVLVCFFLCLASPQVFAEGASEDLPVVLGHEERIVVSTVQSPQEIEVLAKIDTGADCSSLDADVAQQLGIDLAGAERVLVTSALGEEWRPLVEVQIQIAGQTRTTMVTVSDRTDLTTRAIFGKNDLDGFIVDVSQEQRTTPYDTAIPPRESVQPPQEPAIGSSPLLLMLPLATLAILCFVYLSPKENP